MKRHFAFLLLLMVSTISFAQSKVSVMGNISDGETINEPLLMANVSVKGTSIQAMTDENGLFVLDNLQDGNYTLVFSFVGYETKELTIEVKNEKPAIVNLALKPSTFSFSDMSTASIPDENR
jgi:hypothetical protein